jgi:hypothetical protein
MKLRQLLTILATAGTFPTAGIAQQVSVNEQYQGICSGTPLSSYTGWLAIATGITCNTQTPNDLNGLFTTVRSTGTIDWTFIHGPVAFNGLYFSGSGTFYLDLMDGENVLSTQSFTTHGTDIFIQSNWAGISNRVRIRRKSGVGLFGIGNGGIVLNQGSQNGSNGGNQGNENGGNGNSGNNGNNGKIDAYSSRVAKQEGPGTNARPFLVRQL